MTVMSADAQQARLVQAFLLLAFLVGCETCTPVRGYTVVLPEQLRHSWIVIERGKASCGPIERGSFATTIEIPADGYLCTSSSFESSWMIQRYLVRGDKGVAPLETGKDIHQRNSMHLQSRGCDIRAEIFFFGAIDDPARASRSEDDVLKRQYPQCFAN